MNWNRYVIQPLEKIGSTFIEQFTVILLATGSAGAMMPQQWARAADIAGFAAVVAVLTTVLTFTWVLTGWLDLVVRLIKTFIQSFVGVLVAGPVASLSHATWKAALAVAFVTTFMAFLKGLAALAIPNTQGASSIPPPPASDHAPGTNRGAEVGRTHREGIRRVP